MSKKKPLTAEIDRILLVSALRGEVGDIITTWTALGQLIDECKRLKSGDPNKDIWNDELANKRWLADKLRDEIISRLAELGNKKTGRINFYSVALWLKKIEKNADVYNAFMKKKNFIKRRNAQISHKQMPPCWDRFFDFYVSYYQILRGLAFALGLMKNIDREILGPAAPYLWKEARKKRYRPIYPAHISYQLLPHLRLDGVDRINISFQELQEGFSKLEIMETVVNGRPHKLPACKKWGVIFLGKTAYALPNYPLQELKTISIRGAEKSLNKVESEHEGRNEQEEGEF